MKTFNSVRMTAAVVSAALLLVTAQARAALLAYDFPAPPFAGNATFGTSYTLANEFVVGSSDISVTAVGAFNSGAGGFTVSYPVAIYADAGSGTWTRLDTTLFTFSPTSPGDHTIGSAQFHTLDSSVTLNAGSTYAIVGANYGVAGNDLFDSAEPYNPANGVTSFQGGPAITMANPNNAFFVEGDTLPGTLSGVTSFNVALPLAGATFEFTAVPEPINYALAAFGLCAGGICFGGRFVRKLART
jgi:hypothetical protein